MAVAVTMAAAPAARVDERSFTAGLWADSADVYAAILAHPFLRELGAGTLDRKAFAFYMKQDVSYLRAFGDALKVVAARAPKPEWKALLEQHARESLAAELQLHHTVFREYGIPKEEVQEFEPSPDGFAYETFMLATAHTQSFGEALAALLPCYWIYAEVGKALQKTGSKDPTYQKWIDNYASPGYDAAVRSVLAIVDEVAAGASEQSRARMARNFRRAARYGWMFWDSAYHQREWKP
jgi:thiaminase/transcriptional activator TenA